jgi:hypothetical protein
MRARECWWSARPRPIGTLDGGGQPKKSQAPPQKTHAPPEKTQTPMTESHAWRCRVPSAGEKETRSDEKEPSVTLRSAKRGFSSPTRDTKRVAFGSLGVARGTQWSHAWLLLHSGSRTPADLDQQLWLNAETIAGDTK